MSKVAALGSDARRGVVAGSAGNHAQAVAFAARAAGVPCEIYVPLGASIAKTEAARGYGASVIVGGETVTTDRHAVARLRKRGWVCIPTTTSAVIAAMPPWPDTSLMGRLAMVVSFCGGGLRWRGVAQAAAAVLVIGVHAPFSRLSDQARPPDRFPPRRRHCRQTPGRLPALVEQCLAAWSRVETTWPSHAVPARRRSCRGRRGCWRGPCFAGS